MKRLFTTLCAAALLTALTIQAQTNTPPAPPATSPPAAPVHETITVDSPETAFAAWLHFLGFSKEDAATAGILLHLLARTVRNTTLKDVTKDKAGPLAKVTALLAGKPLDQPDVPAAPASSTPTTPTPK